MPLDDLPCCLEQEGVAFKKQRVISFLDRPQQRLAFSQEGGTLWSRTAQLHFRGRAASDIFLESIQFGKLVSR